MLLKRTDTRRSVAAQAPRTFIDSKAQIRVERELAEQLPDWIADLSPEERERLERELGGPLEDYLKNPFAEI
jgi:hypothetical protein